MENLWKNPVEMWKTCEYPVEKESKVDPAADLGIEGDARPMRFRHAVNLRAVRVHFKINSKRAAQDGCESKVMGVSRTQKST